MGIILIIIVAILAVTGLITYNIKALSPEGKPPGDEEENSLEEYTYPSADDSITEIISPTDNDELKMKDQDYRLALSKLHNQKPNDEPTAEKKPNLRKMKDEEYRGTLKDLRHKGD
ncbi:MULTISPECIES: hypothetical protein [Peribacillus]|uniref:hypothetical protein n=1 Tax=Peribacillus TaxID=2675229 RepID=UPI001F4E7BFA|nr:MULTISPECIES: hypothetical protein [unclassified Peribacillus]MCK1985831.1 hypothetical protein [Peribacillus sp. Aquil_B1]MCK2010166.1 hypothetical protein [Peribacillus sp. Aquil_B8]